MAHFTNKNNGPGHSIGPQVTTNINPCVTFMSIAVNCIWKSAAEVTKSVASNIVGRISGRCLDSKPIATRRPNKQNNRERNCQERARVRKPL